MSQTVFDNLTTSIIERLRKRGPSWRLATWWGSDTRDSMQHSLLRVLSVAHHERLDTATLVNNLADEHLYWYRHRLRRLARRLASGTPLVAALEQTPDLLSDDHVLAIRFASQTGTLRTTFQHLIDQRSNSTTQSQANVQQAAAYITVTSLVTIGVLTFLMVFIAPVFMRLLEEFEISPPWVFDLLVRVSTHVANYAPFLVVGAIVMAWLVWSGRSQRFFRRVVSSNWYPPTAQLRSAELLSLLSFPVDAGRPIPGALSTLARYHFDKNVRQKLLLARNEIEQGADVWTSLSDTQLLTEQDAHALAICKSNRSRAWTMRRLATWKRDQILGRHQAAVAMLHPLFVLLMAGAVLFVGCAFFQFLAHLIHELA